MSTQPGYSGRTRLPSTTALVAFEAAARHLSFRKAAEELHLTHGAIAHQVHALEETMGCLLFERRGRGVVMTVAAQTFLTHARQALRALELGIAEVAPARGGPITLVLSVLPALASRWLIPRLADLQRHHPDIALFIKASADVSQPGRDGIDAALRYGVGRYPGFVTRKIADERLFPVCSPDYRSARLPRRPSDFAKCTLLVHTRQSWEPWLRAAGLQSKELTFGAKFDDSGLVLEAAASGQGVALARAMLVQDDIRSGRLVRLLDIDVADEYGYHLVLPSTARREAQAGLVALEVWLRETLVAAPVWNKDMRNDSSFRRRTNARQT